MWPMKVVVGYFQIVAVYLLSRKQIYRLFTFSFVLYSVYWIVCVLSCTMRRKWRMLTYSRSPSLQLVIWFSIFTFFYLLTCAGFSSEWSIYSVVYSTDTKSTSCTLTPYEAQLCIPLCLLLLLSHFSLYIMTKFLHSHRYHSTSVYFVRFALSVLCIWSFYIICFFPCRSYSVVVHSLFYFSLVLDTFRNWFWHLDDIYIGTKMYVVHLAGYASHLFCTDA